MCCFTGNVESVSDTNIFARFAGQNEQFLVYSMKMRAQEELAMVLPIPVPKGTGEDAVKFINLEGYPGFFKDMLKGFPVPPSTRSKSTRSKGFDGPKPEPQLKVVEVGKFEASFVPTVADFKRLDERFRLPEGTWEAVPKYQSYGFAVFKLKRGEAVSKDSEESELRPGQFFGDELKGTERTFHPMAFRFPTESNKLFFPTVHIHDGQVHDREHFDHTLYCQMTAGDISELFRFRESPQPAGMFLDESKCAGLIEPDEHCYQRKINGQQKNSDVWV